METSAPHTGRLIGGRYRLGRALGAGGMGEVYEAVQENLGKRVAVKLLHAHLAQNAALVARFKREAEAAAKLGHPNIVEVIDFGVDEDGAAFLVMEFLSGESLARAIASDGPMPMPRVAFIASQVLSALAAAHEAGVIHRDLKPDNVFLTSVSGVRDIVKLLDFGIAKIAEEPGMSKLTSTGAVLGTPQYMSPEQARGRAIDARSDLYAMGVVMYEALTGRVPFQAENYNALMFAILEDSPPGLETIRTDLDPAFAAVVRRAMARKPDERFESAAAMRDALAPWAEASVGSPRIPSRPAPPMNEFTTAPTIAAAQSVPPTRADVAPPPATAMTPFTVATQREASERSVKLRLTRRQRALAWGGAIMLAVYARGRYERWRSEAEDRAPRWSSETRSTRAEARPTFAPPPPSSFEAAAPAPSIVTAPTTTSTVVEAPVHPPHLAPIARTAVFTGGAHNNVYTGSWGDRARGQVRVLDACLSRPDYRPVGPSGFDAYLGVDADEGRVREVELRSVVQQPAGVRHCLDGALRTMSFGPGHGGTVVLSFGVRPENR